MVSFEAVAHLSHWVSSCYQQPPANKSEEHLSWHIFDVSIPLPPVRSLCPALYLPFCVLRWAGVALPIFHFKQWAGFFAHHLSAHV
jgi:hypothetical protein